MHRPPQPLRPRGRQQITQLFAAPSCHVFISAEGAPAHFGWLGMFVAYDMPASSALTRQRLGWQPTGPSLISDLDQAKFI